MNTSFVGLLDVGWIVLGIVILLIFTRITKFKFIFFLIVTTAYFLIFLFPDVANHVNLLIYLNIALIVGGVYSYFIAGDRDSSEGDNEYYEMMLPLLRSALILVYFLAGFHKLNRDFFNPQVSCAKVLFLRVVEASQTEFLGLPLFSWLIVIFLVGFWCLLFNKVSLFSKNKYLNFSFLVAMVPLAWSISVLLQTHASFLASLILL